MKALKILVVIVLVLVVVLVAGALYLNRYVQSPAFRETVLAAARDALGSEVAIKDMNVSLLSGVTLTGITVANPKGFDGNVLTADAFVLRYRLMPLLQKRVEIEKLAVEKPIITLARNEKEEWNYDKLGGESTPATAPAATPAPSQTTPLDVTLSSLALNHGEVAMLSEKNKPLVKLQDMDLTSAVNLTGGKLTGNGQSRIATINIADSLFVKSAAAPVTISPDNITLAPLSGTCANGTVSGELKLVLTPQFKYVVDLQVKDSDVTTLLQEAKTKAVMQGKLQASAKLEGTGGLPTIVGNGKAEITNGQLQNIPILNLIGTLLLLPELQDLKFNECLLEFSIANNVMQTPVIRVTSPHVQITGKGAVTLDNYTLDHQMTLALQKSLLDKVPNEIRAVFTDRGDGFLTLNFKVTGPYDAPKTDLKERLVKGATDQLIKKGLEQLFK